MVKLEGRERPAPKYLHITGLGGLVNSAIKETCKVSGRLIPNKGFPRIGSYLLYITLVTISCAWPYNTLQIKVLFLMALKLLPGVR